MSILDRLFHREGTSEKNAPGPAQVSDAIERMARLSPQLRLAERYQERLAAAVRTSLDYVGHWWRHAAGTRGERIRLGDGPV